MAEWWKNEVTEYGMHLQFHPLPHHNSSIIPSPGPQRWPYRLTVQDAALSRLKYGFSACALESMLRRTGIPVRASGYDGGMVEE